MTALGRVLLCQLMAMEPLRVVVCLGVTTWLSRPLLLDGRDANRVRGTLGTVSRKCSRESFPSLVRVTSSCLFTMNKLPGDIEALWANGQPTQPHGQSVNNPVVFSLNN